VSWRLQCCERGDIDVIVIIATQTPKPNGDLAYGVDGPLQSVGGVAHTWGALDRGVQAHVKTN
jgi:hypothetical protein